MPLSESISIALNSLLLNRLRAILTSLGIIIGVAAVISLISLGRGVQDYVSQQFSSLGVDLLTVRSIRPRGLQTAETPLTMDDVNALAKLPDVKAVSAEYQVRATVVNDRNTAQIAVQGVTINYADVNNWHPANGGGFFTSQDLDSQSPYALLGTTAVSDLFGSASANPVGTTILINNTPFTVVGTMAAQNATGFQDPNEAILVPITAAQTRLATARSADGGYTVSTIQVQAASTDVLTPVTDAITQYLLREHGIRNPNAADFFVGNQQSIADSRTQTLQTLTLFLAGIAGISLVVGGIGVMNIMLVSVSERTREIGLRKAVGAQASDILSQFLIESLVLSLIGCAGGIAVSYAITQVGGRALGGLTITLSPDVILLATGISSAIGIFFGLYPANRAARMRPIDALRFE